MSARAKKSATSKLLGGRIPMAIEEFGPDGRPLGAYWQSDATAWRADVAARCDDLTASLQSKKA